MESRRDSLDPGKVLTVDEVKRITARLPLEQPSTRIAVLLGLQAGLRVSEIVNLELRDLHLDRNVIYVRNGKGGKSRTVKIPDVLVRTLTQWVETIRPHTTAAQVVVSTFPQHRGKRTSPRAVQDLFKKVMRRAGLHPQRISGLSCHSMRHYYATRCLELGKSLPWVQRQLGHASAVTTAVYLGVANTADNGAVDVI